jgi:hypothetical protein
MHLYDSGAEGGSHVLGRPNKITKRRKWPQQISETVSHFLAHLPLKEKEWTEDAMQP